MHGLPSCCARSGRGSTACGAPKLPLTARLCLQADMLVIGRRGLGQVKQAALSVAGLGSVSSTCVSSAPCPVLVTVLPHVST